ncbi:hypothetical protein VP01_1117g10 [Puccinia sorghi]|uniref:Uncharacterized protein n=1 Tax=Puccinia sorghi TaxID=27349 RepID=A0A0L6VTX8_9BASI|nr:hypothetical protein VP01_1117g10 [Puccinia sorghi]
MDKDILVDEAVHKSPARPLMVPPLTGLHALLMTILGDSSTRVNSAAVKVPARLFNVLLDMSLNTEKMMCCLEDMIGWVNASVDVKVTASTSPILA